MKKPSFKEYVEQRNLTCRACGTQQVAQTSNEPIGESYIHKWFYCLKCMALNSELIHRWRVKGGPTGSTLLYKVAATFPAINRPFRLPSTCPAEISSDYREAAKLLEISAMASAAFSRRCLQSILLKQGYPQRYLVDQVKAVLGERDPTRAIPSYISETVDAIRNFGNFSAHPISDSDTAAVISVEAGEAEWCLEIIENLIDHYYTRPEREAAKVDEINKKLEAAGKPPIHRPAKTS